jgi:hypothetical protein
MVENRLNISVDTVGHVDAYSLPMKKQAKPERLALRPTDGDFSLLTRLKEKLGVDTSQVIRIALRKLAEHEGLRTN